TCRVRRPQGGRTIVARKKALTETDWERCPDPARMLAHLGDALSERKLRLFACACCRRIWRQIEGDRDTYGEETVAMFSAPVPVAEDYADGQATLEQMHAASGWLGDFGEWCSEGPEYAFMDCAGDVDRLRGVAPMIVEYGGLSGEESRA